VRLRLLAVPAIVALLIAACAGCTGLAGGLAGGALLSAGGYFFDDTAEELAVAGLEATRAAARAVLREADVSLLGARPERESDRVTRWDLEAAAVAEDLVAIDIALTEVTTETTRVRVEARSGPFSPDPAMARALAQRIAARAGRAAAPPAPQRSGN